MLFLITQVVEEHIWEAPRRMDVASLGTRRHQPENGFNMVKAELERAEPC